MFHSSDRAHEVSMSETSVMSVTAFLSHRFPLLPIDQGDYKFTIHAETLLNIKGSSKMNTQLSHLPLRTFK